MARDCYTQVFKPVYLQGIADGLAVTVATAAAQMAMADCLTQQSTPVATSLPTITISGTSPKDPGPNSDDNRAAVLGLQQK